MTTNKQISNMQQLLSYQTARRIYGERSYKKYVTKRTCISITFSIGFFTLIVDLVCPSVYNSRSLYDTTGFLLGKFVSHRQYKLRQLYEPEVIQHIRSILHAKQIAENMWDTSITHYNNDSLPTFNDSMLAFNLTNSNLLAKMKYCGQPIPIHLLIDSGNFVGQLLDDEMIRLLNCLKELNRLLDDLRNGIV